MKLCPQNKDWFHTQTHTREKVVNCSKGVKKNNHLFECLRILREFEFEILMEDFVVRYKTRNEVKTPTPS
jgi:hypothetical protein